MADSEDRSDDFFKNVRQGHVFTIEAEVDGSEADLFVVISQTCDIVLPKRPTVVLAHVIELTGSERSQAETETNPRLVQLPCLGGGYFADLCFIKSCQKGRLLGAAYTPGIDLEDLQVKRDFSLSITRWFGRFPFPDDVVPWLRPLEHVIRDKYRKQSALGELLREVIVEIRVEELGQWSEPPYRIDVHTIVRAEAMPTLPDAIPDMTDFVQSLHGSDGGVLAPAALAEVFARTDDIYERSHVLSALAESFSALCKPAESDAQPESVAKAVSAIEWHLWGDDEFPLARIRKSEPLDLEYLSEPDQRI